MSHPLHPALVHFPIALLATTSVWDTLGVLAGGETYQRIAQYNLALGLLFSAPALVTGLLELRRLPDTAPIVRTAMAHLAAVSLALTLYVTSFILRIQQPHLEAALAVALVGLVALVIGGFLGAQLVYRHGVAVHPIERISDHPDSAVKPVTATVVSSQKAGASHPADAA